jgi:hypothetical protein
MFKKTTDNNGTGRWYEENPPVPNVGAEAGAFYLEFYFRSFPLSIIV